jgi:hypothetical protein
MPSVPSRVRSPQPEQGPSQADTPASLSHPPIHSIDFAIPQGHTRQHSVGRDPGMSQPPGSRRHRRSETPLSPRLSQPGAAAVATASTHPYQTHSRHRSELSPGRSKSPEGYGPGPTRPRDSARHRSSMSLSATTSPSTSTHLQPSGSGGGATLWPAPTAMSSIRDLPHPLPPSTSNPNAPYGHPPYHPSHPVSNTPSVMASVYNPQHQQLPSFSTAMGWTSQAATYAGPGPSVMGMAPRRSSKDFSADFTESSEGSIVLGRDLGRERAPRSMMACKLLMTGLLSDQKNERH